MSFHTVATLSEFDERKAFAQFGSAKLTTEYYSAARGESMGTFAEYVGTSLLL